MKGYRYFMITGPAYEHFRSIYSIPRIEAREARKEWEARWRKTILSYGGRRLPRELEDQMRAEFRGLPKPPTAQTIVDKLPCNAEKLAPTVEWLVSQRQPIVGIEAACNPDFAMKGAFEVDERGMRALRMQEPPIRLNVR